MVARRDYSCEIMALVVLIALSALSRFWYIMIVICMGAGFAGACFLLSRIYLGAKVMMSRCLCSPARRGIARPGVQMLIDVSQRPGPSLPVA
jgi:hypothetical protein